MEYLLKSTLILSLFYVFYKLFLQKETFFQSIRFYFMTGIITAIAFPFIIIKKYVTTQPIIIPNLINIRTDQSLIVQESTFSWNQILIAIYILGVFIFLTKFLIHLTSLFWFLYKNPKCKKGNFTFVETEKDINPFSFFNYIVVNPSAFKEQELTQIVAHEKTHATQFHSIDNLWIQFITIFHWFNPLVWLYTKEVQKNLEFIADEHAQGITTQNQNYQHLLLKTISPNYQMALTTNFYNSIIKKRIDMLQKNRSNKTMQFKFLLIIPMLIAFIFTFNTKVIAQKKDEWKVEIKTDRVDYSEIITKDTKNHELEKIKENFAESGTKFNFKKLKRNNKDEITGISITVKNKAGNVAKLSQQSDKPISAIKINDNLTTGELSIGNASEMKSNHNVLFVGDPNKNNNVHFTNSNKSAWISDKNVKVISGGKNNSYVIVTDENDKNKTITVTVDDDKNIRFGDSTKIRKIKIFKIDDNINASQYKNENQIFISSDGKKPLFIIDGKETKGEILNDMAPDNVKSINVLKGEAAIKKYGEKGKNGVVEIYTKNIIIMATSSYSENPLIIVDGKEIENGKMDDIDPDTIKSMNVLKGETATKKYGEKGKGGVVEITTKK